MRDSSHNQFLAVLFAIAVSVVLLRGATDDCTSKANLDPSAPGSSPGNPNATASTTANGCSGRTVRVWASFPDTQTRCNSGETYQSQCFTKQVDQNAVVSISVYNGGYGDFNVRSTHNYDDGAATTDLGTQYGVASGSDPVDGGTSCPPGDYFDPITGLCEINPDAPGSPILIATDAGNEYRLTSANEGVLFDIDGDGVPDQIGWTRANDEVAFLAIDRNGDGQITSGKELFGNFTLPGVNNGFAALRIMSLQTNGGIERGEVSSDDPLFSKLLLWTDRNHNGISEANELRPASEVLAEIGLGYQDFGRRDQYGNQFRYRGWARIRTAPGRNKSTTHEEEDARRRPIYDVFFQRIR